MEALVFPGAVGMQMYEPRGLTWVSAVSLLFLFSQGLLGCGRPGVRGRQGGARGHAGHNGGWGERGCSGGPGAPVASHGALHLPGSPRIRPALQAGKSGVPVAHTFGSLCTSQCARLVLPVASGDQKPQAKLDRGPETWCPV